MTRIEEYKELAAHPEVEAFLDFVRNEDTVSPQPNNECMSFLFARFAFGWGDKIPSITEFIQKIVKIVATFPDLAPHENDNFILTPPLVDGEKREYVFYLTLSGLPRNLITLYQNHCNLIVGYRRVGRGMDDIDLIPIYAKDYLS